MSRMFQRLAYGQRDNGTIPVREEMPNLSVVGMNQAVSQQPTVRIQIYPGVITMEDLQPLITADGAPVAASTPGTWGQLYAAGRM